MKELFNILSAVSEFLKEKRFIFQEGGETKVPRSQEEVDEAGREWINHGTPFDCAQQEQGDEVFKACKRKETELKRMTPMLDARNAGLESGKRPKALPAAKEVEMMLKGDFDLPDDFKAQEDDILKTYLKEFGNVTPSEKEIAAEVEGVAIEDLDSNDDGMGLGPESYERAKVKLTEEKIEAALPDFRAALEANMNADDFKRIMVTLYVSLYEYPKTPDNALAKKAKEEFIAKMASNDKLAIHLPNLPKPKAPAAAVARK